VKQFEKINELLMRNVYSAKMPSEIVFDIDSTNFETYGKQHGSAYKFHYSSTGYHPLLMFDDLTGDLIKVKLRSGNVYTSRQVVRFIGSTLKMYTDKYSTISRFVRGDSGFANPKLYELTEENKGFYAIRLKANTTLHKKAAKIIERMDTLIKGNMLD
jgi:hypothetical protein